MSKDFVLFKSFGDKATFQKTGFGVNTHGFWMYYPTLYWTCPKVCFVTLKSRFCSNKTRGTQFKFKEIVSSPWNDFLSDPPMQLNTRRFFTKPLIWNIKPLLFQSASPTYEGTVMWIIYISFYKNRLCLNSCSNELK